MRVRRRRPAWVAACGSSNYKRGTWSRHFAQFVSSFHYLFPLRITTNQPSYYNDDGYAKRLIGNAFSVATVDILLRSLQGKFPQRVYPNYTYPFFWKVAKSEQSGKFRVRRSQGRDFRKTGDFSAKRDIVRPNGFERIPKKLVPSEDKKKPSVVDSFVIPKKKRPAESISTSKRLVAPEPNGMDRKPAAVSVRSEVNPVSQLEMTNDSDFRLNERYCESTRPSTNNMTQVARKPAQGFVKREPDFQRNPRPTGKEFISGRSYPPLNSWKEPQKSRKYRVHDIWMLELLSLSISLSWLSGYIWSKVLKRGNCAWKMHAGSLSR